MNPPLKLHCLIATVASAALTSLATAAPIVTFVGTDANQTQYRTTTVIKTLDADGNNVYGTDGYVLYAMDTGTQDTTNGFVVTSPLAFSVNSTGRTYATLLSAPSYASLANNGQNTVAYGFGNGTGDYPNVDNPAATPGPSVTDIESGFAINDGLAENPTPPPLFTGNVLDITFNGTAPSTGVRIGVIIADTNITRTGIDRVTLGGTTHTTDNTGGVFTFKFFDVTNITSGDVLTLALSKDAGTASQDDVFYYGLTFDTIPEPGTVGLLAFASGLLTFRRRR